jgi:hypothetical protein
MPFMELLSFSSRVFISPKIKQCIYFSFIVEGMEIYYMK